MAAINLNTGEIMAMFEGEGALEKAFGYAASIPTYEPTVVVGSDDKAKIEEVSRVLESRAHLQSLRVELEKRERRLS